jgi:hypothetical protein
MVLGVVGSDEVAESKISRFSILKLGAADEVVPESVSMTTTDQSSSSAGATLWGSSGIFDSATCKNSNYKNIICK